VNPFKAWNRFLFAPISARPLGLFRVVFGTLMVIYLLVMLVEFDYWYTDAGLLQGSESFESAGPLRFSPLHYVRDPVTPHVLLAVTFAAAVCATLGWRTRVMSVILWVGMLSFYHRNPSSNGGPDAVPVLLCFYLMLCPSGAAYSLDARREERRRGTPADRIIAPWGVRLLQMQLCLIYFQSCVIKCDGATWMDGTAVHYVLYNHEFNWFNLEFLGAYPIVVNLMTHVALLIEFALAFWLWFRPTRRWAIVAGILLHAGIRPVLNIPGFGETMCAAYLTFLDPDETMALLRALDPRGWLARLGLRRPDLGFLRGREHPLPLPSWQQRELAFDRDGRAVPEPIAVR
jgi:HTTM domain